MIENWLCWPEDFPVELFQFKNINHIRFFDYTGDSDQQA
jgi:hypothetical protein